MAPVMMRAQATKLAAKPTAAKVQAPKPHQPQPPPTTGSRMELTIQPRLQHETWSLYWKDSMKTQTSCLKPLTLSVKEDEEAAAATTVAALLDKVAAQLQWPPEASLTRLPGFEGAWTRALHKGRWLQPHDSLAAAGVDGSAPVTVVRVELIAEGWRVADSEFGFSSSDDEDDEDGDA